MAAKKTEPKKTLCDSAVTLMTFGPGYEQIAFVPNNHQIHIASVPKADRGDCSKWKIISTLNEHAQLVAGLAWGHKTNKILSCAHDRTAFVWSQDEASGEWVPVHVLLDAAVKRGLTGCSWNPKEDRAFISSAAFNIAVGKDDAPNPFWSCVVVQPHVSTITCIQNHPTIERVVATGSSDCSVKITLAKGKNPKAEVTILSQGWVLDLQWSPNGNALAYSSQGCNLEVASGDTSDWSTFTRTARVRLPSLPIRSIAWVTDELIIGGGYDFYPLAFTPKEDQAGEWQLEGKFAQKPQELKKEKSMSQLAKEKFTNEANFGTSKGIEAPETKHKNTISCVLALPEAECQGDDDYRFVTSAMDGRVEFWKASEMQDP